MKREMLVISLASILILSLTITLQSLVIFELGKKSGLVFADEDVIITVNETNASFYARYAVKNYDDVTNYWIALPFALKPWDVNLTINNIPSDFYWTITYVDSEPLPFEAIRFKVQIEKNQKLVIEVNYFRNFEIVEENSTEYGLFKYIVGSTRSWSQPLEFAHFELWQEKASIKTLLET
ncbi:MAG: hypothetical protein KAQ95_10795, partial [Candidatus Heimdallarchaeota archaeon]|nr:hypothetical protein [Candidatus Heimdallarchaeota archaeon]